MTEAEILLEALCDALNNSFISHLPSTARWQYELDNANEYLDRIREKKEVETP